ncbi:amidohydrolase family protein [Arthrobacter zhaoxinii]|uniref:Amidohydrolase family protein n=1 Tax=Arthrobacter zhaoxinii TaxID=2964616 RepID=A0ABY5YQN9_9MICC|nr:amidohydrolase family protein [Arthrobacter zhaoxinii]UWX97416.1 amidohydrolase family protein [Arthrobacter zhaoxinii]
MTTYAPAPGTPRTVLRGRAVLGTETLADATVAVEGTVLAYAGPGTGFQPRPGDRFIDLAAGEVLVPGLIDLHCHGAHGVDFSSTEAEDVRAGITALYAGGTTTLLASLVTAAPDALLRQLGVLAGLAEEGLLAGLHLEGPFLAAARCGAQDPQSLQDPDVVLAGRFISAARGHLRTMTYAPELAGADQLVDLLAGHGVIPSLGHTACSPIQAEQSLARSRRMLAGAAASAARPTVTHMFNAMDPLHHRAPGALASCLRAAKAGAAVVELIADSVHLDPVLVATMFELLGAENIALVTDSMAAAGLQDGQYRLGPAAVTVRQGTARVTATGAIAGGTASMLELVRNSVRAGVDLQDAVTAAALVPARVLGIEQQVGQLVQGAAADLLVLGADLELHRVMRRGQWLSPAET